MCGGPIQVNLPEFAKPRSFPDAIIHFSGVTGNLVEECFGRFFAAVFKRLPFGPPARPGRTTSGDGRVWPGPGLRPRLPDRDRGAFRALPGTNSNNRVGRKTARESAAALDSRDLPAALRRRFPGPRAARRRETVFGRAISNR